MISTNILNEQGYDENEFKQQLLIENFNMEYSIFENSIYLLQSEVITEFSLDKVKSVIKTIKDGLLKFLKFVTGWIKKIILSYTLPLVAIPKVGNYIVPLVGINLTFIKSKDYLIKELPESLFDKFNELLSKSMDDLKSMANTEYMKKYENDLVVNIYKKYQPGLTNIDGINGQFLLETKDIGTVTVGELLIKMKMLIEKYKARLVGIEKCSDNLIKGYNRDLDKIDKALADDSDDLSDEESDKNELILNIVKAMYGTVIHAGGVLIKTEVAMIRGLGSAYIQSVQRLKDEIANDTYRKATAEQLKKIFRFGGNKND